MVAQGAGFGGASRGVVLRVEVEYQLLALIVAQQYLFSLFVDAQNFGRFVSYIHDSVPFLIDLCNKSSVIRVHLQINGDRYFLSFDNNF